MLIILQSQDQQEKHQLKNLTGFCLNKLEKTYFSKKSFNNKFGVPLSII